VSHASVTKQITWVLLQLAPSASVLLLLLSQQYCTSAVAVVL
jgi:hypothetical protein